MPFQKGVSGNPKGAPKRGESMREIAVRIGNMDSAQAIKMAAAFAKQLKGYPKGVTLKELLILAAYASVINDPQPGLFGGLVKLFDGDDPTKDERDIHIHVDGVNWKPKND